MGFVGGGGGGPTVSVGAPFGTEDIVRGTAEFRAGEPPPCRVSVGESGFRAISGEKWGEPENKVGDAPPVTGCAFGATASPLETISSFGELSVF